MSREITMAECSSSTEDTDAETLTSLRAELADVRKRLAKSESRCRALECENTDLQIRMKDVETELNGTRNLLGKATYDLSLSRSQNANCPASASNVASTSTQHIVAQGTIKQAAPVASVAKRARSPSLEIIEVGEHPRKKGKGKEKEILVTPPTPDTPQSTSAPVAKKASCRHIESRFAAHIKALEEKKVELKNTRKLGVGQELPAERDIERTPLHVPPKDASLIGSIQEHETKQLPPASSVSPEGASLEHKKAEPMAHTKNLEERKVKQEYMKKEALQEQNLNVAQISTNATEKKISDELKKETKTLAVPFKQEPESSRETLPAEFATTLPATNITQPALNTPQMNAFEASKTSIVSAGECQKKSTSTTNEANPSEPASKSTVVTARQTTPAAPQGQQPGVSASTNLAGPSKHEAASTGVTVPTAPATKLSENAAKQTASNTSQTDAPTDSNTKTSAGQSPNKQEAASTSVAIPTAPASKSDAIVVKQAASGAPHKEVPANSNRNVPGPSKQRTQHAAADAPATTALLRAVDAIIHRPNELPPPLAINPPPLDIEVPRTFLRVAYGGSDQHFLQFIQKEMNPSGPVQRRIVFPMLDMNPSMPSKPGQHGFVFASRHEILQNLPWSLFCKRDKTKAVWMYLGEYENVVCGKVTRQEFVSQKTEVKQAWARALLKSKGAVNDVYIKMRARIALRKQGLLPVDDKKAEEDLVDTEVQNVRGNRGIALSDEEVISAICRGDESIDLVRMTCVKYDHVFANDIARQFPNYHELLAASKQKKHQPSKATSPCKTRQRSVKKHESPAPPLLSPSPSEVSHYTNTTQQEQASRRYPERVRRQSTRARISYALDESSDERGVSPDECSFSE